MKASWTSNEITTPAHAPSAVIPILTSFERKNPAIAPKITAIDPMSHIVHSFVFQGKNTA